MEWEAVNMKEKENEERRGDMMEDDEEYKMYTESGTPSSLDALKYLFKPAVAAPFELP